VLLKMRSIKHSIVFHAMGNVSCGGNLRKRICCSELFCISLIPRFLSELNHKRIYRNIGIASNRRPHCLRCLETVSSTYISMGGYNHSLSLDATIIVLKKCSTIGEHIVIIFVT